MTDELATGAAAPSAHETVRTARARQLPVIMDDAVAARLSVIGRTEDVAMSPDGQRLAVACFGADRIALVELSVERDPALEVPSAVLLRSVVMVECQLLSMPHGLAFVDDRTLMVANRGGDLVAMRLPPLGDPRPLVSTPGRLVVDGSSPIPVRSPGSVAVLGAGGGLAEVLVCENDRHVVSRHVVDTTAGCELLDSEELVRHRLEIPDGVTVSPSGEWMAVSNHCRNEIFLYRYTAELGPADEPAGVLEGSNFPHGLRFSADGRYLLIADAGLPYIHTYAAGDGDWSGTRQPARTTRVMDDDEFLAGKYNPQEGGPKGLDTIGAAGVVVVTSEHQTLAFFDIVELGCPRSTAVPDREPVSGRGVAGRVVQRAKAETVRARAELEQLRQHSAWQSEAVAERDNTIRELSQHITELEARLLDGDAVARDLERVVDRLTSEIESLTNECAAHRDESIRLHAEMQQLESSTSWRVTGPMRAIADRFKHR